MGALDQAEASYREHQLDQVSDNEDILALRARLLKDRARLLSGEAQMKKLQEAADAYFYSYEQTDGSFSAINAASLFLLCGQTDKSKDVARWCLHAEAPHSVNHKQGAQNEAPLDRRLPLGDVTHKAVDSDVEDRYFYFATRAEAHLILGDSKAAEKELKVAIAQDPLNWLNHAVTVRQLQMINNHLGFETDWLDRLRPPGTCHFAGSIHAFAQEGENGKGEQDGEQQILPQLSSDLDDWALRPRVKDYIHSNTIGEAYGALAAGADILLAEYFLKKNIDLHVVLPCPPEAFSKFAVSPFGEMWERRFDVCLNNAASVTLATQDGALTCPAVVDLATIIAMGKAMERADLFATSARQITLSAEEGPGNATKPHIQSWRDAGYNSTHISVNPRTGSSQAPQPMSERGRFLATMLFVDVAGFGALNDSQVMKFLEVCLLPITQKIEEYDLKPCHRASWGDGIFLVYDDPVTAANAALDLQGTFGALDFESAGLPPDLKLRIGGHFGPATIRTDPITSNLSVYGSQVSYAARIEPDTLPGSVFISEAFAAALRLYAAPEFRTYYTGKRILRRNTPAIRLFNLSRK